MPEHLESTLAAAERAIRSATKRDATVITNLAALERRPAEEAAVPVSLLLTTVLIERIPEGWISFCPADRNDAANAVQTALRMGMPSVIAVTETPVLCVTAPTDVIDPGWPNIYLDADAPEVALVSTGPVLHLAMEVARQLAAAQINTCVLHLPIILPLKDEEVVRIVCSSRAVLFLPGHPMARATFERLRSRIPDSVLVDSPTLPALFSTVRTLLGADLSEGGHVMGRPRFAERMNRLGTENAFEVLAVVNRLKAEGRDIISFAIGEPDFPTPSNIKAAGRRAIEEDRTHYGESQGLKELREAIARHIRRTRRIEVGPENVVITPGAKPILFNTIMALVNPGDEVIYPNPGFPIYESLIDWVGAKSVPLPLWESLDFNFDPDQFRRLVTDRTRLVILNTPHNPTAGVLTKETLDVVAEVAEERDIWVLADEVYSQMVYDGEFVSIASLPGMAERTIILDGFSKTYSMTGWRLGYGVMPADLATWEARIETNLNSCTATFTQWAGLEALTGQQDESDAMIAEFKRRRSLIVDGLNSIPGFSCKLPGGAFYAFPNVTEACRMLGMADSKAFQEHLLFEGNVAVLPRTAFGRTNAGEDEEYIRFSYATAPDLIQEGLARIGKVMEGG